MCIEVETAEKKREMAEMRDGLARRACRKGREMKDGKNIKETRQMTETEDK